MDPSYSTFKPTDYGLISIEGPEAKSFLQGQFTCDVNAVTEESPCYGGTCDLKGRLQSFFRLFLKDSVYYLRLPLATLPSALAELKKYGVFSDVEIKEVNSKSIELNDPVFSDFDAIQHAIPEIYPETQGLFLPHHLNLHRIGALSFTKGCYRGQEIVIRMEHQGTIKRTMKKIHLEKVPELGQSIEQGKIIRFAPNPKGGFEALAETLL